MEVIKRNTKSHTYKCPECGSVVEIKDAEFVVKKVYPPFPYLMGIEDFIHDTRIKIRTCDCPVCGATIVKETRRFSEQTPKKETL